MAKQSSSREFHHVDMRLSYADCDPAGIIYFSTWFPWMERVQTEWLFNQGLRQDTMMERFGFTTLTRSAECEYVVTTQLYDEVRVALVEAQMGTSSCRFMFRMIRRADGMLVARGSLVLVTVDRAGVPVPVPEPLRGTVIEAMD